MANDPRSNQDTNSDNIAGTTSRVSESDVDTESTPDTTNTRTSRTSGGETTKKSGSRNTRSAKSITNKRASNSDIPTPDTVGANVDEETTGELNEDTRSSTAK